MDYTKEKIERNIARLNKKIATIKAEHGETPSLTHTYHGGWSLGYWEGRLSAFEDILGFLEENEQAEKAAKIERARLNKKIATIKAEHGETSSLTHTYHSGWLLGYWEGRLSALEDFLGNLEEN